MAELEVRDLEIQLAKSLGYYAHMRCGYFDLYTPDGEFVEPSDGIWEWFEGEDETWEAYTPRYAADGNVMLALIQVMQERGYSYAVESIASDGRRLHRAHFRGQNCFEWADALTPPQAVARAALAALQAAEARGE